MNETSMICPKCQVEMKKGIAICPKIDPYARCIVPQTDIIPHKALRLIDVFKCPKCGYSDNGKRDYD